MAEQVSREQVVAFRLASHRLANRASASDLLTVSGACGVQNSPPGSALLALGARLTDLDTQPFDSAIEDRSLLQTWSLRGAPYFFPTDNAAVFTAGVLPTTETGLRNFILGAGPDVDRVGITLSEAVELTNAEIRGVLSGRRLAIQELGAELAERIVEHLTEPQRQAWLEEGPHAKWQPLGEAIVHFTLRILSLQQVVCFAPREGNKAPFVLTDEWLGRPVPEPDAEGSKAELLRRFLHCYGPTTKAAFAAWLGGRTGDVDPWWSLVTDELTPIDYRGKAWLLAEDLPALRSADTAKGVRLLPPRDAYIQIQDRETLVPKDLHREVWRTVGSPGTVLADGEIVGTWRSRKVRGTKTITVTPFGDLPGRHRKAAWDEACVIGKLWGAPVELEFDLQPAGSG